MFFSVYYIYSRYDVTCTDMLKHMYSIYFSVHYDHERDERMFAIFDGASARPENILGESRNLREG